MKELDKAAAFKLQIAVGSSALTYRYGNVQNELRRWGFRPDVVIPTVIEGGEHLGMAKTAALGMLEFATAFNNLKSDYIVVRGDRFEILPIATAAAYLNKAVVHLEGGDVSGSIDESVRHAVTKLAHVHFVTNKEAKGRLIKMGERREMVWDVGSLDIDFLKKIRLKEKLDDKVVNEHGVGSELDLASKYMVVIFNPVTSEANEARWQTRELLGAVHSMKMQAVWIWPNLGAGAEGIAKKIREWQVRQGSSHRIRFIRYLPPEDFSRVVYNSSVVVGNSSTGIKECGWMGVPVVNVGTRQEGRLRGRNVKDVEHGRAEIGRAISEQSSKDRYQQSNLYGNGDSAKEIVRVLKEVEVDTQKRITY